MQTHGIAPAIIIAPYVSSDAENETRRLLLAGYRGFGRGVRLFSTFPRSVQSYRAMLDCEELGRVRYINDEYWIELSGGSRSPVDAARRVAIGIETCRVSNALFYAIAHRQGEQLPELILVGTHLHGDLVVLEGHGRLIAAMLVPSWLVPVHYRVIVGISPEFEEWDLY